MRKLLAAIILMTSIVAWADAFQDGIAAYKKGDHKTALMKFVPLADKGNAAAQYHLGAMYNLGQGVAQDYEQALRLYTLAAQQGNARAQSNLGVMYGLGEGVVIDHKQSVRWYILAAEQGDATAQENLGSSYFRGLGVNKDTVLSHMWYNLSVANGNTNSIISRSKVQIEMTPQQISKAQKLARECQSRNFKNCN